MAVRSSLPRLLAICALIAAPAAARAQDIRSPYRFIEQKQELTLTGGHIWNDAGALGLGIRDAVVFGALYDIRLSGPFNFEAGVSVIPSDRLVRDTVGADTTSFVPVGTANVTTAMLDAALRFDLTGARTYHGVLPYLVMGIGMVTRLSQDANADTTIAEPLRFKPGTRFAGQFGAGIEWIPSSRVGIKIDARDHLWKVQTPTGMLVLNPEVPDKEWLQHASLTLGLTFRF